jgi:hypothetical protein
VCGCCKTAIATGDDGSIYVAFRNIYPGSLRDISSTMSRDTGRTFSPAVGISEDHWMLEGCPDDGPTMAIDHDGVVHVVRRRWSKVHSRRSGSFTHRRATRRSSKWHMTPLGGAFECDD